MSRLNPQLKLYINPKFVGTIQMSEQYIYHPLGEDVELVKRWYIEIVTMNNVTHQIPFKTKLEADKYYNNIIENMIHD